MEVVSECKRSKVLPSPQSVSGMYGPVRGGLMDPRNYVQNQNFSGCQGHARGGCQGCQGMIGQGMLGQGQGQGLHGQGQQGQLGQGQGQEVGQGQNGQVCPDKGAWELQVGARSQRCMFDRSMQCSARFRSWRHVHGTRNRRCDASAPETPRSVKAYGRAGTDAVIACETDTW